jgi:hypothetical protein
MTAFRVTTAVAVLLTLYNLTGCAAVSTGSNGFAVAPDGNVMMSYGNEAIPPAGKTRADMQEDYQFCYKKAGNPADATFFFAGCMSSAGYDIKYANGVVSAPNPEKDRLEAVDICRDFGHGFVDGPEAFVECMSNMGQRVRMPDGSIRPAHMPFNYNKLVLLGDARPAPPPPTPSKASDSNEPNLVAGLLSMFATGYAACKAAGGCNGTTSSRSNAPTTSFSSDKQPDLIDEMGKSYFRCGDMWGCN